MNIKDLLKDAYKDGMTVEDIEKALESIELPSESEIERLKKALSKSNSEANEYKKQLREKMSADEIKEREDAEKHAKLQSDYEALLRKVQVSEHKAKFLALNYDDKLATETAEALVNGELDKVFANQKKHLEAVEKKIKADMLQGTPRPDGGSSSTTITKEALGKMTPQERLKYSISNPDEYNELYKG